MIKTEMPAPAGARPVKMSASLGHRNCTPTEVPEMILDMRTYTCKPGMIKKHIEVYKQYGLAPQTKHLGQPVVWATTEVGDVNSYVHIWAYKDIADRAAKRAAMWEDKDWITYTQKSAELGALLSQENKILVATDIMPAPPVK